MKHKWMMLTLLTLAFALFFQSAVSAAEKEVKDVVCGMKGKAADFKYTSEYKGKTYNFCSTGCKQKFDKEPAKYLDTKEKPATVKKVSAVTKHGEEGHQCDPSECKGHEAEKDCPMMNKKATKTKVD